MALCMIETWLTTHLGRCPVVRYVTLAQTPKIVVPMESAMHTCTDPSCTDEVTVRFVSRDFSGHFIVLI